MKTTTHYKSPETRERMSYAHKGVKFTAEHKRNMSIAQVRRSLGLPNQTIKPKVRGRKMFQITTPIKEHVYITDLKLYCTQHDLSYNCMKQVNIGKLLSHRGYTCTRVVHPEEIIEVRPPVTEQVRQNLSLAQQRRIQREDEQWKRTYVITLPDGSEVRVPNLKKYCLENDLSYECMKKISYGKFNQHKGYSCVRLDPQPRVPKPKPEGGNMIITFLQAFAALINRKVVAN